MAHCEAAENTIDLAIGLPQEELLPLELVQKHAPLALAASKPGLLQYGDDPGAEHVRATIAKWVNEELNKTLKKDGEEVEYVRKEEMFITNGISSAIALACSLYTSTNSYILVEEPAYFLAHDIFRDFKLNIISIPVESDGMNLEVLQQKLVELKEKDIQPAFLYTIPVYHNPTGFTMSHEKRKKLIEIAIEWNLLIFADEVYQLLYFDANNAPPPPLCHYDTRGDLVISMNTFSKILAPGLRLGWIQSKDPKTVQKFVASGLIKSGGGMNPFPAAVVCSIIESGDMTRYLNSLRNTLKTRCEVMCDSLDKYFGSSGLVTYNRPTGGYFLWIKMKEPLNSLELFEEAKKGLPDRKDKVSFQPGPSFTCEPNGCLNCARLSFSYYPEHHFPTAIELLSLLLKRHS